MEIQAIYQLRPQCLPKPQVNVDRDLLVVKWSDKRNSNVARYEVRYNDESNMIYDSVRNTKTIAN